MNPVINIFLPAELHNDAVALHKAVARELRTSPSVTPPFRIKRKSLDARRKDPIYLFQIEIIKNTEALPSSTIINNVSSKPEIHIIGAGPAGLFCALQCIELGLKPVLFERGKNVKERRRDLAILNKQGILNEESNYCFGEGGAGTYSDGKLYTRSHKRGNLSQVLQWFHRFGADENILYEAHPHIGTNKLPKIIENIRNYIIASGGEVHFQKKLTDLQIQFGKLQTITLNHDEKTPVSQLVLATGHSARDIYFLLHRHHIHLEAKAFALGVRIEHPQQLIDQLQYHCDQKNEHLPPASYSLVHQVNGSGVFSFCMCPGGIIAPASTEHGALVVNGWSPSKRNNAFANSGMVVTIQEQDFDFSNPLAGIEYQQQVEQASFLAGGGKYVAPAQRMIDFVNKKTSHTLPSCSYLPGIVSRPLHEVLPPKVFLALAEALPHFGQKMSNKRHYPHRSYYTNEALLVASESRTSSPVRIPRLSDLLHHPQVPNLYPCAEGAGYAGGIVSAAMDGMRIALQIASNKHPMS